MISSRTSVASLTTPGSLLCMMQSFRASGPERMRDAAPSVRWLLPSNEGHGEREQGPLDAKRVANLAAKAFGQVTDDFQAAARPHAARGRSIIRHNAPRERTGPRQLHPHLCISGFKNCMTRHVGHELVHDHSQLPAPLRMEPYCVSGKHQPDAHAV